MSDKFEKVERKDGTIGYFYGASHVEVWKGYKSYWYLIDSFNFASKTQLAIEKHFGLEDLPQMPYSEEEATERGWTEDEQGEWSPP